MRTDPRDTGGMFIRRRPGTAPVRYRDLPQVGDERRRQVDRLVAVGIAGVITLVSLCFWGPIPLGWLWVAGHVQYYSQSIGLALFVAFVGVVLTLLAGLVVLRQLDHAWILVRRAAGHDQRRGVMTPIFGACAAVGVSSFTVWLLLIGGLGPMLAPRIGG